LPLNAFLKNNFPPQRLFHFLFKKETKSGQAISLIYLSSETTIFLPALKEKLKLTMGFFIPARASLRSVEQQQIKR